MLSFSFKSLPHYRLASSSCIFLNLWTSCDKLEQASIHLNLMASYVELLNMLGHWILILHVIVKYLCTTSFRTHETMITARINSLWFLNLTHRFRFTNEFRSDVWNSQSCNKNNLLFFIVITFTPDPHFWN